MPFEMGAIGGRMFSLGRKLPKDAVERFARRAAIPPTQVKDAPVRGWVTGRHLLDRNITEETALYGGYLRLTLQTAERKIPAALLRAECKMEELAHLAATGQAFVNRKERNRIKQEIAERLLPQMPPQIRGLPMVAPPDGHRLWAAAGSAAQCDVFSAFFQDTTGVPLRPLIPEVAALERQKTHVRDWTPASFAPDIPDAAMEVQPGRDFLTWLWFRSETGDTIAVAGAAPVAVLIQGPLVFAHEGNGAHETIVRHGEPVGSAEAKTCLLGGKKLRRATFLFTCAELVWSAGIQADEFVFSSLALPPPDEALDPVSRFQERMRHLDQFGDVFLGLYDVFVAERNQPAGWHKTCRAMQQWIKDRAARK